MMKTGFGPPVRIDPIAISGSSLSTVNLAGIHINTLSKKIIVANPLGIHARPAAMIAKLASASDGKVWLIKEDEKVDAGSIIDILTLGCSKGTEVTLHMESQSDEKLFTEIALLIEQGIE